MANAEQFRKVAQIIKSERERKYIIASAPGKRFPEDEKITDLLYKCYSLSYEEKNVDQVFKKIEERYNEIINDLNLDLSLHKEFERIRLAIEHHAGRDYIASRGEYLNGMILAKYLDFDFVDAEKGIFFKENGVLDSERTNSALSKLLEDHCHAVIPGFYGSMPNGTIKTFSRGGSDITGSIVAHAVKADLYENWTDVSGVFMADPRLVDNPKVIRTITYKELREMAYMGATVLHEDAIFPVRLAEIPINIRNTNNPEDKGTMIVPQAEITGSNGVVTGIAGKKGFSTITIEKGMMNSELGFGRRVFEILENNCVSFEHIPSGIDAMSIIVSTNEIENKREQLINEIYKRVKPEALEIEDGLALIAVVGRNMVRTKGTAARIFTAVAKANINIRMIDQGASELNIIIGVEEKDFVEALKAIYSEFESIK